MLIFHIKSLVKHLANCDFLNNIFALAFFRTVKPTDQEFCKTNGITGKKKNKSWLKGVKWIGYYFFYLLLYFRFFFARAENYHSIIIYNFTKDLEESNVVKKNIGTNGIYFNLEHPRYIPMSLTSDKLFQPSQYFDFLKFILKNCLVKLEFKF